MSKCIVTYRSFDPLEISIECDEKETFTGDIQVRIIDVEIKVLDLSMGMEFMKGAGAYGKGDMGIAKVTVDKLPVGKLYEMFIAAADNFKEVSDIVRKAFKEKALLG